MTMTLFRWDPNLNLHLPRLHPGRGVDPRDYLLLKEETTQKHEKNTLNLRKYHHNQSRCNPEKTGIVPLTVHYKH